MRKFIISAALVTATLAAAAPVSAQWARPVPQGNAYGYNNYGQVRRLEVRVQQIRRQIQRLDRRNILSDREARRLSDEARELDQRINMLARNGFNNRDRFEVERRLARLEQRLQRDVNDGRRHNGYYANGYANDRDRDGRDDRYEDDRGRDSDRGRGRDRDDD